MSYLYHLIPLLFYMSCTSQPSLSQEKLEVFYVPRTAKFESMLSIAELTELDNDMISYYCTVEPKTIGSFKEVVDVPSFVLKDFAEVSPYIYIVLSVAEEKKVEIVVDDAIYLKMDGKVYRMSKQFQDWLNTSLPEATLPIGVRINECS